MRHVWIGPLLVLLLAGSPLAAAQRQTAVQEGLTIDLTVTPADGTDRPLLEGDSARVRLEVKDKVSGAPVSRLYPGAWMDREGESADCRRKSSHSSPARCSRPRARLNTYYVLALTRSHDLRRRSLFGTATASCSPGVPKSRGGLGVDRERDRLFVSMPASTGGVVESADWKS